MNYYSNSQPNEVKLMPSGKEVLNTRIKSLFLGKQSANLREKIVVAFPHLNPDNFIVIDERGDSVELLLKTANLSADVKLIVCDASIAQGVISGFRSSLHQCSLVVYSDSFNEEYKSHALSTNIIDDYLYQDLGLKTILSRLSFLASFKQDTKNYQLQKPSFFKYNRISLAKRTLDILSASVLLLLLSPILLLIALIIRFESSGPAFFISKRVGTDYKIFDFYKFRTMKIGADKLRNELKYMNEYESLEKDKTAPFFFKIKDDPRVTRFGKLLRKTSLDELPQLFNVLKGDMSLVGNRPLPLDEAATLTRDEWAQRFLAPSGMTGLWQISKSKDEISVPERIELDIRYAKDISFRNDLRILWKTVPAMLQK
ncbi:MAG: sugar transferase [Cyclobacteriaceae bacterium]